MEHLYYSVTILVVIIGWIVTNYLNKRHEITKRCIDFRIDMLQSAIKLEKKFRAYISEDKEICPSGEEFAKAMEEVGNKVELFGNDKEVQMFININKQGNKSGCIDLKVADLLLDFVSLAKKNLRKEFRIR